MVLDATISAPTFTQTTSSAVATLLNIFQEVVNFVMNQLTTCLSFIMSNPLLMISLGIITIGAIVGLFRRFVRI